MYAPLVLSLWIGGRIFLLIKVLLSLLREKKKNVPTPPIVKCHHLDSFYSWQQAGTSTQVPTLRVRLSIQEELAVWGGVRHRGGVSCLEAGLNTQAASMTEESGSPTPELWLEFKKAKAREQPCCGRSVSGLVRPGLVSLYSPKQDKDSEENGAFPAEPSSHLKLGPTAHKHHT